MKKELNRIIEFWGIQQQDITVEKLLLLLADRIVQLLINDKHTLFTQFYLLKIPEQQVQNILQEQETEKIPLLLAELVIKREFERREDLKKGPLHGCCGCKHS